MIIFSLTVGLIILLALGVPVSLSLILSGAFGYLFNMGSINGFLQLYVVPLKMSYSLSNFLLLSIPLFIMAAKVMNSSSITKKIFGFANTAVGWLPGGLGHANVFASLLFAGMSGTAVSDAAGLGSIEIEAMKNEGYDSEFAAAVTAASSTVGPIFPPSVPMVMFATVSSVSVGSLFLAGVVPGVIMTIAMMILVYVIAKKRNYPRAPFPTAKSFAKGFIDAFIPLLTPIILLVGIWTGVFTTTESAVIATAYAILISFVLYRDMSFKSLFRIFKETAIDTASIGLVVAAAAFYGWVLARSGLTVALAEWVVSVAKTPTMFLIMINIFFLIIGCFLESIAAILIFGPILVSPAVAIGVDPLVLGLVIVLNLSLGLLTPPFGIVLFITKDMAKVSFGKMVKAVLPFFVPLFGTLILITFCPQIATFLPHLLS